MKSLFAIASVVAFSVCPAMAAEGRLSEQSLSNLGLAGMQTISDNQGLEIRGLAIAVVGGHSTAHVPGASSTNFYFAAGKHSAEGANESYAGTSLTVHHHTITRSVIAGGSSSAKAR